MVLAAGLMVTLHPVTAVVGVILLAHAWAIPELYANRGREGGQAARARWARPRRRPRSACSATWSATRRASCTRARAW